MGFLTVILIATIIVLLYQRSKSLPETSLLSRIFEPFSIGGRMTRAEGAVAAQQDQGLTRADASQGEMRQRLDYKAAPRKILSEAQLKKLYRISKGSCRISMDTESATNPAEKVWFHLRWEKENPASVMTVINVGYEHDTLVQKEVGLNTIRELFKEGAVDDFVREGDYLHIAVTAGIKVPVGTVEVKREDDEDDASQPLTYRLTLPKNDLDTFLQVIDYSLANDDVMSDAILEDIDAFLAQTLKS